MSLRGPSDPDGEAIREGRRRGGGRKDASGVCPVCGEPFEHQLPQHLRRECEARSSTTPADDADGGER